MELLIRNSDHTRASQFRQFAKDEVDVVKDNLAKYLPPLVESYSRRFLSTMKPKAVKNFLQKFIGDIVTEKSNEIDETISDFVRKVSSDFKMTFELDNFAPIGGQNYFAFKIFFDLFKNSSDHDENNLKNRVAKFSHLAIEIVDTCDVIKLKKKFKDKTDLWQNLVRGCLKHGLKLKLPFAVDVLTSLCRATYGKEDSVELSQIYDMVCGHSNFVDILLSTSNKSIDVDLKSSVLNLILTLIHCKGSLVRFVSLSGSPFQII